MEKRITKRIVIGVIIVVAAVTVAQLLFYLNVYLEKRANHEKVARLVNEDLMFRWETMDEDLARINDWIDHGHFYNEDLGRLYERASLIYLQKGEVMPYYKYLGYALYYLERSSERDYTINIYLDLANFFLNNYAEDSARKMVEAAQKIRPFDDIEDIQIKSYAFRMQGILATLDGNYDQAEKDLIKANEIVDLSNYGYFEDCYRAIDDVWLGRVYTETGRYDECKEKLDKWDGNPMFTQDIYREILLRDLIIPFYQVKCMYSTALIYQDKESATEDELIKKESEVGVVYKEFVEVCEENDYKKTELYTLLKLQKEYPPVSKEASEPLAANIQRLYNDLFNEQNIAYANAIDSTVLSSIMEMGEYELSQKSLLNRRRVTAFTIIAALVVVTAMLVILLNSRIDGLTKIQNRKMFNRALARIKKRDTEYGIIMMDIDHFKDVNDTFGHQNGDVVLERLGEIILAENNSDVHGYRYGGEEFVILLSKKAIMYSQTIAERIRMAMQQQKWPFDENTVITISGGIATGGGKTDVLKQADENLYKSKESGRNRITVSDAGA